VAMDKWSSSDKIEGRLGVVTVLRRNTRFLVLVLLLSITISTICYFVVPRKYVSTATILPSPSRSQGIKLGSGSIGGIGLLLGLTDNSLTLNLYPEVLRSRKVGLDILKREYEFEVEGKRRKMTLMEYIGKKNEDVALAYLNKHIASFWIDRNASSLVIRAVTSSPELSSKIVDAYVERLEMFNKLERVSSARDIYRFIREKFSRCGNELKKAELELKKFRERNREYAFSASPELQIKHRRLLREVELKRALYIELGKELKKAQVKMEKDTPVLNVLDRGEPAQKPYWPVASRFIPGLSLVGLILGIVWVVCVEYFRRLREGETRNAVNELLRELKEDLNLLGKVQRTWPVH